MRKRLKRIRNFEYNLQERIEYNHPQLLTEVQGVNVEILDLCEYLWMIYRDKQLIEINDEDMHSFVGFNVRVKSEFCDSIAQLTIMEGNGASNFQVKQAYYNEETMKLENVHILIFLKNLNNKQEFIEKTSHELMHAYDLCVLYDKNLGTIPNGQKTLSKRYDFNIENMAQEQFQTLQSEMYDTLYMMFSDEHSSFFESLYAYIISNPKINRKNYYKFLENTQIYNIIQDLESALTNCATLSLDKKTLIGSIYKKYIFSHGIGRATKMTDERAFKRFVSKLEYVVRHLYKKLYRVIGFALDRAENNNENRKPKKIEHHTYDTFEPFKGWLFEKH